MTPIYQCPHSDCVQDWDQLPPTTSVDHDIRTCMTCLRSVYRCHTREYLNQHLQAGNQAACVSSMKLPD